MTESTPQAVRAYLAHLDEALVGVQPDVRAEIVSGIREELTGLDPASAADRIADLGDPQFIAAEARAEQAPAVAERTPAVAEPAPGRTLSIVAVVVLIAGSFVVPIVGALVGLVWVTLSSAWSRREKLLAWLIPIASAIVVVGMLAATTASQNGPSVSTDPTLPVAFAGGWHLAILIPYFILPIEGVALLVRAHGRGWRLPQA